MTQSYLQITPQLARQIRLVMADVDGTLTHSSSLGPLVSESICRLEECGIMVGLVSGRTLPGLEALARDLGISGPVIAENGAVARIKADGEMVDLGYSRQPALRDLAKLKRLFPDAIAEREDNQVRLIDVVFRAHGVDTEELRKHLEDTQLLDSGYILHLVQQGVSKGRTLMTILAKIGNGDLSPEEVLVFGDSLTDMSLFELFPYSVLITNASLPVEQRQVLQGAAGYKSILTAGDGFAEVVSHILEIRAI